MSEPTVSVVLKRIRTVIEEEPDIFKSIRDEIENLLSRIEKLTSYLNCPDEIFLPTMTEKEKEEMAEIDKVINTIRGSCSFIRRFLVQIAHDFEDVIDSIVIIGYNNNSAYKSGGRFSLFKKKDRKSCNQIDKQYEEQIQGIIKRMVYVEQKIEMGYGKERKMKTYDAQVQVKRPKDRRLRSVVNKQKFSATSSYGPKDRRLRSVVNKQKFSATTSYGNEVVGLEHDINSLVEKLTKKENQVSVLCIVGREGSGKTTLATELSNHYGIKEHFESVVWASASGKRDSKDIFLEILRTITGQKEDAYKIVTIYDLLHQISDIIKEKPCLIMIDDVQNPDNLIPMIAVTQRWSQRSKFVITTRATPSHPYKNEVYDVNIDDDVVSLAKKLTVKKASQTSIFHLPARRAEVLLLSSFFHDKGVTEHFDFRIWINIKSNWNDFIIVLKIMIEIITYARQSKYIPEFRQLANKLENFLLELDQSIRKIPADILHLELKSDTHNSEILFQTLQVVLNDNILETEEGQIATLIKKLKGFVATKSYLIVLDQVKNPDSLERLLHPFLMINGQKNKAIFINSEISQTRPESEGSIIGVDLLDTYLLTMRLIPEWQPSLFSIRNLHGSGYNTALSRKLYHHTNIMEHFDRRVWFQKSGEQDVEATLKQIIKKTTGTDHSSTNLVRELADILWNEKLLLILNDLGDSEDLIFDLLAAKKSSIFRTKGDFESKIILNVGNPQTFRHSDLKCYLYEMQPLTTDESWRLLCSKAVYHAKNRSNIEQVISHLDQKQRKKIIKTCNGVPLTIVSLGELLSTKETATEWEKISNSLTGNET